MILVFFKCLQIDEKGSVSIVEHFLEFVPVEDTSGGGLTDAIVERVEVNKIPLDNMRGQGYDNGANMKGKNSGVQKRILNLNNRAFFVPCHAHTLNLVVCDAAKASRDAVAYFGMVQSVYNFLSGSTKRWAVLKIHLQNNLTIKPLSQTRWESRIDAIKPFRNFSGEIFDSLFDISQDPAFDSTTRHEAEALAKRIRDFRMVSFTVMWHKILNHINIASKLLQNESYDLSEATNILKRTLSVLKTYRSDIGFHETIEEAREMALKCNFETSFVSEDRVRSRHKRKLTSHEGDDEPILDPALKFKVEGFNGVLDAAINSIEERFAQLKSHEEAFTFLYDIGDIKNDLSRQDLRQCCEKLQVTLTDANNPSDSDIDGTEIFDELIVLTELIDPRAPPAEVLSFIVRNDYFTPNVAIALRILLTLPVTVASGERSFSRLKIIKNYLRSTMSQERLSDLATLSIESDVVETLDFNDLINDFANSKVRKVALKMM